MAGDVLAFVDGDGDVVAEYEYDAWGNCTIIDDDTSVDIATLNPIRYRGYYYDTETKLYYLQSRYYDPSVGRFISADSEISGVGGDVLGNNMFSYCLSNPVNMSDPTGHWPSWLEGAIGWINNNFIQPVKNFFNPNTYTVGEQFEGELFRGSGTATAGYSEMNCRLQINAKDDNANGMFGVYGKASAGNATGKLGIGNENGSLSIKGVGDGLSATAQAGFQYKNGFGVAAKAKAAVLTGRVTTELELFGWQVEFGVSGDLLSVCGEAMIGLFPNEGFTAKASAGVGLFGGGFVFRVKPNQ